MCKESSSLLYKVKDFKQELISVRINVWVKNRFVSSRLFCFGSLVILDVACCDL